MCMSFARWACRIAGYCDDHMQRISSLGNSILHNLRSLFQRFEMWAAMSHCYLHTRDSWMTASVHEASQMYQRMACALIRALVGNGEPLRGSTLGGPPHGK